MSSAHQETDQKQPKKTFMDQPLLLGASTPTPHRTPSFKEDTYHLHNLKPSEKKALQDLKTKLTQEHADVTMWGVPLLPSTTSEKADVILLKFLRARDFRVQDAFSMLVKCLAWRKEFGADVIVDEELGFKELEGVVAYMNGYDKEGHPVCYNAYVVAFMASLFSKTVSQKCFACDLHLVGRFWKKNFTNPVHWALVPYIAFMHTTEIIINDVEAFQHQFMMLRNFKTNTIMLYSVFSPFLTQRTKSKFVLSKEGNAAETLYKYIRPEDVPVQYGGLSRPSDANTGPPKPASEFTVKGGEKVNIQIEGIEAGATITWDIVVGGWDLEYSAEYVPIANGSYTIAVEKSRKMAPTEEAVHNSYTAKEAGKLVLSVDNSASRKRKVASYRYLVRKSTVVM
ncbi:SEC14 cytosolic factor family protein / phosphoglyceride transfer family protein [Artemisia annua]|uniref:SEC14 cytosolic factor family protein / phosphoglyceride transfer family protein n=1 Tax=Artemisia annua TaxID=35608 RepID=A0A2U1MAJ3_ARTAN|nr:SEC14 cytosolic factor family protein / phosphoglyceride transfer family protein [Artemisia annua]